MENNQWRLNKEEVVDERWRSKWPESVSWNVCRSSVSICLILELGRKSDQQEDDDSDLKKLVRNQVLDLGDWNSFAGYIMPVVCIVLSDDKTTLENWKKLAGDQEWGRGQFSLQIASPDDVEQRLEALLGESFPDVSDVQPLSDSLISERIREVLDEVKTMSPEQRRILEKIADALTQPKTLPLLEEWDAGLREKYHAILDT